MSESTSMYSPDREILTPAEVAAYLKVSRAQAYNLIQKSIPYIRVGGNRRVFRRDLEDWVENNRTIPER